MSRFVVVKQVPQDIKDGDYLIDTPSFIDEIALHRAKMPKNNVTGSYYLRMIVDSIAQKYDPENMTAYSIKTHKYEGLPFNDEKDVDKIILNALKQDFPSIFAKYLDFKIKNRPFGTRNVIYVDSKIPFQYEIFYKNGLSDEPIEMPKKEKSDKVVGKPALTKEQAELLKKQQDLTNEN